MIGETGLVFGYKIDIQLRNPIKPWTLELMVHGLAEYLVHLAKATVPVRTGRLKGSIHVDKTQTTSTQDTASVVVVADIEYAAVVEYGRVRFAPFPGRFYMARAINMLQEYVDQYLQDMIDFHGGGLGGE